MKQVYTIGTIVSFTYETTSWFKKITKDAYIIRNVRYVYAESESAAKEKYKKYFYNHCNTYKEACNESTYHEGFDPSELRYCPKIKMDKNEITRLYAKKPAKLDDYKQFMLPDDFRDWWWDGYEQKTDEEK